MPTSLLAIWPYILEHCEAVPHDRVLDVGPGHGKGPVLLREYLSTEPTVIDAVEAWPGYITAYNLLRLYDDVYHGDATGDTWQSWRTTETFGPEPDPGGLRDAVAQLATYDLVLMGDVIEHMHKPDAHRLIDRIPGHVVICTPERFFDNDPTGIHPHTEKHVSHWRQDDWDTLAQRRPVRRTDLVLGGWVVTLGPRP